MSSSRPAPVTTAASPPFPPVRYAARHVLLVVAVLGVAMIAGALVVGSEGLRDGAPVGGAIGAGAFVVMGAMLTVLSLRAGLLRVVLTGTEVVAPGVLHGRRVVALTDVSGVGMRYLQAGRSTGWRLCVWRPDGQRVVLGIAAPGFSAPPGRRRLLQPRDRQAPALDWDYLADCPAGRAALDIRGRVLAVQGPTGPLTARRLEATAARGNDTAYWSPDGSLGPL